MEVTTPKFQPLPRRPQNRSRLSASLAVTRSPSAVTTVADLRLSQPRPILRCTQPKPQPSVKPAIRLPLLLTLAFLALTAPLIHPAGGWVQTSPPHRAIATFWGQCPLKKGSGAKFNYVDLPDLHSLDLFKGQLVPRSIIDPGGRRTRMSGDPLSDLDCARPNSCIR